MFLYSVSLANLSQVMPRRTGIPALGIYQRQNGGLKDCGSISFSVMSFETVLISPKFVSPVPASSVLNIQVDLAFLLGCSTGLANFIRLP